MDRCLFTVQQRDDLRWHIFQSGFAPSLASFGLRDDAVDFARDLARANPEANVRVITAPGRRRELSVV